MATELEVRGFGHRALARWEWLTDDVLRLDVSEHCLALGVAISFLSLRATLWHRDGVDVAGRCSCEKEPQD